MTCQSATLLVSLVLATALLVHAASPLASTTPAPTTTSPSSNIEAVVTKGLSDNCMTAAVTLLTSQFTRCVDIPGFVTVLDLKTNITSSLKYWTDSFCSRTCSEAVLKCTSDTVMLGCSTDMEKGTSLLPRLVLAAVQHYATVRHLACAETVAGHENCYVTLIQNLEQANNAYYTIDDVLSLGKHLERLEAIPTAQLCSDCNKVLFIFAERIVRDITVRESLFRLAQSRCDSSFIDGALPTSVTFVEGIPGPNLGDNDATTGDRTSSINRTRGGTPTSDGDPVVTLGMQLASLTVVAVAALLGGLFVL